MGDEEVHPTFSRFSALQGDQNGAVSYHDGDQEQPQNRELFDLKARRRRN